MAQAPMGAPQGIRLSQLLALLQQGQQQPPAPQAPPRQEGMGMEIPFLQANQEFTQGQQAPPPQKWRGVGMGGGMVDAPPQPQGPKLDLSQMPGVPGGPTAADAKLMTPPGGGVNWKNAADLGMKLSPWGATYAANKFVGGHVMDLLKSPEKPLNFLGQTIGSGPVMQPPPQQAAPQATPAAPPQAQANPEAPKVAGQMADFGGDMVKSSIDAAAKELAASGADTPDKADQYLRMEFKDDPEIEDALAQAKIRYAKARQRSSQNPGVLEYIGYALATLAGFNPMQAAEAISRRGEKREDERLALQDLMGAQGMKIRNNQMQNQMYGQSKMLADRLKAQGEADKARQQGQALDDNFRGLNAARTDRRQRLRDLEMKYPPGVKPSEADAREMELLKAARKFFGRQLGEPTKDENGNPIGQVSPDAMRLLGWG